MEFRLPTLFKKSSSDTMMCGLSITRLGIHLAHLKLTDNSQYEVLNCEYSTCANELAAQADLLATMVKKYGIDGANTCLVLPPDQYKLIQMDAPPVTAEEIGAAARWKVKDLIDFPFEDALVDAFRIPDHGAGGKHKLMYVVVARSSRIQPLSQLIADAGLQLNKIDITELAYRNVVSLLPENERGTAYFYINNFNSGLIIGHNANIYLARNFKYNLSMLEDETAFNNLVLEIQRSYDYYSSQMGQPDPAKLYLTPLINTHAGVQAKLQNSLSANIDLLDWQGLFTQHEHVGKSDIMCSIPAIGGALCMEALA